MEQEKLTELLIQYMDNQLSIVARDRVTAWLVEDEEIKLQYDQLMDLHKSIENSPKEVPSERMTARFDRWLDLQQSDKSQQVVEIRSWYRVAAGLLILLVAGGALFTIKSMYQQQQELARIKEELQRTKQLVMKDLGNQQSASQRMNAVYTSQDMASPDADIINLLIKTMNEDPNSNVRMAALDALSKYYKQTEVRAALLQSMKFQKDPVVQIALIQLLVQMKEKIIIQDLETMTRQAGLMKAVKDEAYQGIFKLT